MKKQKLLVTIFTLLVIVVGVSFAFFLIGATITGEGASTRGETADLIDVTYLKGEKVEGTLYPGKSITKEVKVKLNPGKDDLNKEATYAIFIDIEQNDFQKCTQELRTDTNQCELNAKELTYTIKEGENDDITPDDNDLTGKKGAVRLAKVTKKNIESEVTYTYTITITFNETNADQNHNNNATFSGSIRVEFADEVDPICPDGWEACETILANTNYFPDTTPDFNQTACDTGTNDGSDCENTDKGLYKTQDDDGTTYYFRGSVTDNWVKFAGYYWRIIRINGDGTIRLIYSGKTNEENLTFPSTNKTNPAYVTGTGTQVTISGSNTTAFNTNYNQNRYVGYMYGNSSSTYDTDHKNDTPSNIKSKLESWYSDNLASVSVGGKTAKDYIDTDAGFCGDRTPYNGSSSSSSIDYSKGGSTTTTYYGGYFRLVAQKTPDLHCKRKTGSGSTTLPETNDLYTVNGSSKGNKALTSPVGLISADEVTFAGGRNGANNQGYYLYTNQYYWTMSPYYFNSGYAQVFVVYSNGSLSATNVYNTWGVRPVINLKADTKFTFTHPDQPTKGTYSNPYEVS